MWARFFKNKNGYLQPWLTRLLSRFYGPFFGAGIRITKVAPDYRTMRVEMPLTWYNRNYVGVQFGGSIYAMCDPFYMLMLIMILGNEYVVWDKAANVDFIKPGRNRLIVDFSWSDDEIALIKSKTSTGEKYFHDKEVLIHDSTGLLVARVIKTLYVRRKDPSAKVH